MRRQLAATLMNISARGMISNQFSRAIFHAALARHEEASEVTAPTVLNQSLIGRPGRRRSRGLPAVAVGISCESRRSPVAGWPALADNFSLRRVSGPTVAFF